MRSLRLELASFALALSACQSSSVAPGSTDTAEVAPVLSVHANRIYYRPGDSVTLLLANLGDSAATLASCVAFQCFDGSHWIPPVSTSCPGGPSSLPPAAATLDRVLLNPELPFGVCRIAVIGRGPNGDLLPDELRTTKPFRITTVAFPAPPS